VRICLDAGMGYPGSACASAAKIAKSSGQPVDARVEIIGLKRDAWQSFGPTQVPEWAIARAARWACAMSS